MFTETIGASFVDDTDLFCNQPTNNTVEIKKNIHDLAQEYYYKLTATGGCNSMKKRDFGRLSGLRIVEIDSPLNYGPL